MLNLVGAMKPQGVFAPLSVRYSGMELRRLVRKMTQRIALRGAIIAPTVTPRAAITNPEDFGGLLRAIDSFGGQPTTLAGLKLLALLFPRPGELRFAEWPEFNFEEAVWTIPAMKTKMRREHRVPLSKQALAILQWSQ